MKEQQDYIQQLSEIRSMMERSSKFMSLAGAAGIMAGVYALAGSWLAARWLNYNLAEPSAMIPGALVGRIAGLMVLILILAVGTAAWLSSRKAARQGKQIWTAVSRRMLFHMSWPLFTGGLLMILFMMNGLTQFLAPFSLLFYGLALINAGMYTYNDIRYLGILQIFLGLLACWLPQYGLICWASGFGFLHIFYGAYMHFRYDR